MRAPTSTYRLQISPAFTLDDAVLQVDRIADLGVSHLYLSPLLRAAAGSTHGYDVVDHAVIDPDRGGEAALRRLANAAHTRGLGIVLDIVPNHMSVATPAENAQWWDVLRLGERSTYAPWFDIDWAAGPLLLPLLGSAADVAELRVVETGGGPQLAYYDHRFPIAPGTEGGTAEHVHERQFYRLVDWRRGASDLTYRRFFDVTSLAGLRVEDRAVYDATHALILALLRDGVLDGLRIDHPDGLAQPESYLRWLAADTNGCWVVVEKILEPGEHLPTSWQAAGTTGYDAARLASGVFVDAAGSEPLAALWRDVSGDSSSFGDEVLAAKRAVAQGVLAAEVARLHRMAPEVEPAAIAEVLSQFPVYRSYLPESGGQYLAEAMAKARAARTELAASFDLLGPLLESAGEPFAIRFQQTSGMVMAKGVEDTAFYRRHLLISLNEVGGDPARFGVPVSEFHAECAALQRDWPHTMTLLSSHDTKRSEDVRARISLLAQMPSEWERAVLRLDAAARPYAGRVGAADRYLLHQTLVGTGPISAERLGGYLEKATREAKTHTSWTDPDPGYDDDISSLVRGVLGDTGYLAELGVLLEALEPAWRQAVLAQKLLQLTMPGIPDVYQGSERFYLALVDPDNRRPVDWAAPDDAKTELVRTVLRMRNEHPELFEGYEPIMLHTPLALAFHRSPDLAVVIRRLPLTSLREGWPDESVPLPEGEWYDELTGRVPSGSALTEVLGDRPGAVLRRSSRRGAR